MSTKTKKPSPAERWSNLVSGRLTDKQIFDLFDEFGMAKRLQANGDYDWVRHNLPNIPEEIKKILKMELDKENATRKEAEKARAEAAKPVKPVQQGQDGDGQGGPAPVNFYKDASGSYYTIDGKKILNRDDLQAYAKAGGKEVKAPISNVPVADTSIAMGANTGLKSAVGVNSSKWTTDKDISLVQFNSDPNGSLPGDASTIWWVDHNTRSFRPIMSMQALKDLYLDDASFQAAQNSINKLDPSALQDGGKLAKYMDLGVDYGIFEGRESKKLTFNPADITNSYGQTQTEDKAITGAKILDKFMILLSNPDSGIDGSFLSKIKQNQALITFYTNALAYGGYTPDDIYKDIKKEQLLASGDKSMENVKVISSGINRNSYVVTNQGRLAQSLPSITSPSQIGNVSQEVWDSPAASLSDAYYQLTDPESYNPNSQTLKDQVDAIKPAFYDFVIQSLTANNEVDKTAADAKWMEYKTELEKTTGYKFSDNALEAWKQLEAIEKSSSEAGISGSGIEAEQIDKMLAETREANRRIKESMIYTENSQEAAQARAAYSPAQVKALNDEDSAKGLPREQWRTVKWGLTPKVPVTLASVISNFRTTHPDKAGMTDTEIKEQFYDQIYDENGNIRSTLYQNYQDNVFKTKYGSDAMLNAIPGTSEQDFKNRTVLQNQLDKDTTTQKDAATLDSGETFDPLKGEKLEDYQDPTIKAATEAAKAEAAKQPTDNSLAKAWDAYAAKQVPATAASNTVVNVSSAPANKTPIPVPAVNASLVKMSKKLATPAPTVKKATQWDPVSGKKEVMTVGDPFKKDYSLYTGK